MGVRKPMIIFLYGADTLRSRRQLKKIIEKFKTDRDPQGLNVSQIDAERTEPGAMLGEMLASPFLAERRMVVIENVLVTKHDELRENILERIKNNTLPEINVLVFWEGTDTFKTKSAKTLFEQLKKEKFAQKFDELKAGDLFAWAEAEFKEHGGIINRQALQFLLDATAGDMWRLHHLIRQLAVYKGSEEIRIADISEFIDEKADNNIFNLVDAIVAKQPKQVFAMMREQYRNGEDAGYIFAMILRQFRILLQLRDLFEREDNPTSDALAARLGLHPFVVKKSLPLVKRYTMRELEGIYQELLECDINTKTGRGDQSVLLDLLVGRVTSGIG